MINGLVTMRRSLFFCIAAAVMLALNATCGMAGCLKKETIDFEARLLMNRMEITRDVSSKLKTRLNAALNEGPLSELIAKKGAGAVFVYACGEGGLFVKYMSGNGLISFAGGRQAAPFFVDSWGIGAMIGGSAQWGVGILIGPADESNFSGRYKGGIRSATAWEAATRAYLYLSRQEEKDIREIYVITTGRGLTAGVGGVMFDITPAW